MPKDFRGQEIEVGDRVVYASGGRYTTRMIANVVAVKKKVKIVPFRAGRVSSMLDDYLWVEPESCFAIEKFKGEQ